MARNHSLYWMRDLAGRRAAALQPGTARTLLRPMLAYCSAQWQAETLDLARHALAAAQLYVDLAEPDQALGFLGKALPILERQTAGRAADLAAAHLAAGEAHLLAGGPGPALEHLLAAAGFRGLFGEPDEAPELALKLALAYAHLAAVPQALQFARWALGFQQRRHGVLHLRTAITNFLLAQLIGEDSGFAADSHAEREVLLRRAIGTLRQTRLDDAFLGHGLIALGELHVDMGDLHGAIATLEEAVTVVKRCRGQQHVHLAWAKAALGQARARSGHREAADGLLRQALDIARAQPFPDRALLEAILDPLAKVSYDLMRLSDHVELSDELKRLRSLRGRPDAAELPREAAPESLPAFAALAWSQDDPGDRQLASLG
ncbi:MAG: tetratricopeptide repeat protein [Candidatus Sericytochromatia bacterium]|nr:tetratricopeptide repeat protein [Candidatus Tanganyikabacteria bacterium]